MDHMNQSDQPRDQFPRGPTVSGTPVQKQSCPEPNGQSFLPMNSPKEVSRVKVHNERVSTWAFSDEVRQVLEPRSGDQPNSSRTGTKVSYMICPQNETLSDTSALNLPPKDYIIHLAQIADFHLNTNYLVFDYPAFLDQLNSTPLQSLKKASEVWHVKLLMVIALGRLFLGRGATSFGPPGIREFLQGVNALPSNVVISQDPLMAIETLCLLATYAEAADMHSAAYLFSGQASRLARSCGLDKKRGLSKDLESTGQDYKQNLWWTICVLDQKRSATIGANVDYQVQEPNDSLLSSHRHFGSISSLALRFNLLVANQLTRIMTAFSKHAYAGTMSSAFMNEIIVELVAMQRLGKETGNMPPLCYEQSLQTVSRPVATLHLLYYHCIVIATKPILLHLMKLPRNEDDHKASINGSLEPAFAIMRTCVNAACCSLNIMSALREQNLLEIFSFCDLEITFLAALSLVIANAVIPNITESSFVKVAKDVLQDMSQGGNIPATLLKSELDEVLKLTPNLPPLHGRASHSAPARRPATMVEDGRVLNNAILHVIEIQPVGKQSHYDPSFRHETAPGSSMGNQQPRHEAREATALIHNPSWRPSLPQANNGVPPPPNNIYIHNFDPAEHGFTFDMEGLQWLDNVQ
ncbi:hypothetical protein BP6252_07579 [Coleophoma cylindrospora]|uniref:Xylanolytic transcriptional activator regulatory domain-containing protein n=1 Tax=Coleophoma cylindrospora TaxID=1849047 RepID=A0A3D8RAL5_9HELO|nr:hypothetical protein BP6252_07579 [Coleophoma cylindrospora]